jgi:hypothetical protein
MARQRDGKSQGSGGFQAGATPPPPRPRGGKRIAGSRSGSTQSIPDVVARRMARRIAVATGIPSLMGMAVIVASYLLVSRGGVSIPPVATLLGSGACFLLGLLGLSYGVISASWEDGSGTLLGFEQIPLNVGRIRESVRAMRQGSGAGG